MGMFVEKYSDDEIKEVVKKELIRLNTTNITVYEELRTSTTPSCTTVTNRFKTWNNFIDLIGLQPKNIRLSKDEVIESVKAQHKELGRIPTKEEVVNHSAILTHFDSLSKCYKEIFPDYEEFFYASNEAMENKVLKNIEDYYSKRGIAPTVTEYQKYAYKPTYPAMKYRNLDFITIRKKFTDAIRLKLNS